MAITNDLPSVFCWVSQMASSHISSSTSGEGCARCTYRGDTVVHGVRTDKDGEVELSETGDLFKQRFGILHRRYVQQREQQRNAARLFDTPCQLHSLVTRPRDDDLQSGQREVVSHFLP